MQIQSEKQRTFLVDVINEKDLSAPAHIVSMEFITKHSTRGKY